MDPETQPQTNTNTEKSAPPHKLSALIRAGCAISAPARGTYYRKPKPTTDDVAACALGAAYLVWSIPGARGVHLIDIDRMIMTCGITEEQQFQHPLIEAPGTIHNIIVQLNDDCGIDREAIADWVESQGL